MTTPSPPPHDNVRCQLCHRPDDQHPHLGCPGRCPTVTGLPVPDGPTVIGGFEIPGPLTVAEADRLRRWFGPNGRTAIRQARGLLGRLPRDGEELEVLGHRVIFRAPSQAHHGLCDRGDQHVGPCRCRCGGVAYRVMPACQWHTGEDRPCACGSEGNHFLTPSCGFVGYDDVDRLPCQVAAVCPAVSHPYGHPHNAEHVELDEEPLRPQERCSETAPDLLDERLLSCTRPPHDPAGEHVDPSGARWIARPVAERQSVDVSATLLAARRMVLEDGVDPVEALSRADRQEADQEALRVLRAAAEERLRAAEAAAEQATSDDSPEPSVVADGALLLDRDGVPVAMTQGADWARILERDARVVAELRAALAASPALYEAMGGLDDDDHPALYEVYAEVAAPVRCVCLLRGSRACGGGFCDPSCEVCSR